ncbi:peptidyl-prolyl cis-trans isomerase A (cyclophilin A)/peptidyl-prolyl cis-trans isomerase B (cyclophilin B) [Nitrosomonas cryotolerans]|uniref:Peptidyl-prolyl cis-trans isomerase n=1 Tax=Nitrosomonas cryotolerans ATCC 49181 TaxID=1131553 RepID=A0A1N6IG03_9PROT|nr:peptidylprolyl isomerase [Nitrosomonas cryotolerans]SFP81284.1 peptidyl-prolyl cis-trans isomerase A (cyclophilin A)/peptidyl-prolyl cis-trans isomerase B (cyclophilin B) [Nitrosomonas cryotolerans]SIO30950.1 peptidyl-prolyl cis-trans isomerase B (cyclophilin B) [Nitrosomonas cryotolerans ATCC 49181]
MHFFRLFVLFLFMLSSALVYAANSPHIKIQTNMGSITLELYPDEAPKTVENFLRYVEDGFYQNTLFHRVIPRFMIQGGGFDKTLNQKPTRQPIENEASNGLKNQIGTIAMARTSDPHSATAQFFINVANNTFLDYTAPSHRGYGYTVFGKVISGMEIVNKIASTSTGARGSFSSDVPKDSIIIEKIELIQITN